MGYETLIRDAIAGILSPQFESMKMNMTHVPWIGDDGKGNDAYGAPRTLRVLVEYKGEATGKYTASGLLIHAVAVLLFIDPIPDTTPNVGKTREGPIDTRDKLIFPDGSTAPIVDTGSGFADSGTGNPFATQVTLGTVARGT